MQPGQTLVDIVDNTDLWVVANFRETQMPHISVGRKVRMTADAVPGVVFWGTVERISDATGSAFSLIPQGGATHSCADSLQIASEHPTPAGWDEHGVYCPLMIFVL